MVKVLKRLIPHLPAMLATRLVCALAGFTTRAPLKPRDREALQQAQRLHYGRRNNKVAWRWGDGPLILLIHGWGGHAAQMAPLAQTLAAQGYCCVAPDVTGHGHSPGKRTSFAHFIQDTAALAETLNQELYAVIGHSAGGLAMMAARAITGLNAAHYVSICAPLYPYVPIDKIRKILNPPPAVLAGCSPYFAAQFNATWGALCRGLAYQYSGHGRLMLAYDLDDDQVNHGDGDFIHNRWPGSQLLKTRGLGHNKILWDSAVIDAVTRFLSPVHSPLANNQAATTVLTATG